MLEVDRLIPPPKGYILESQDMAVAEALEGGRLEITTFDFYEYKRFQDAKGNEFYIFDTGLKVYSGDLIPEVLAQLKPGETTITNIRGRDKRPDRFEGEELLPVAALLVGNEVLFCSKGFNLRAYFGSQEIGS